MLKENVEFFDTSSKDELFRAIENSVVKKEFKLEVPFESQTLIFTANTIYPATLDAMSASNEGNYIGASNYKHFNP